MNRNKNTKGYSLVEVIVALAVLTISAVTTVVVSSEALRGTYASGDHSQALLLAEEGLVAVKSIAAEDYLLLTDGLHGVATSSEGWSFVGFDRVVDVFTHHLDVSPYAPEIKQVSSVVSWSTFGRPRSVTLTTLVSDWYQSGGDRSSLSVDVESSTIVGGNILEGVLLVNSDISSVIISAVTLDWVGTSTVHELSFGGDIVWSVDPLLGASSGSLIDITNTEISVGTSTQEFVAESTGWGSPIRIGFTFTDGSIRYVYAYE